MFSRCLGSVILNWREKRDNKMPRQFQPLLNSDVQSVREFAFPESDCIATGEPM